MIKYTPHEASLLVVLTQSPTQETFECVQDRLGAEALAKARDILAHPESPENRLWAHHV